RESIKKILSFTGAVLLMTRVDAIAGLLATVKPVQVAGMKRRKVQLPPEGAVNLPSGRFHVFNTAQDIAPYFITAIGPCIILTLRDTANNITIGAHFDTGRDVPESVKIILGEVKSSKNLKANLYGGWQGKSEQLLVNLRKSLGTHNISIGEQHILNDDLVGILISPDGRAYKLKSYAPWIPKREVTNGFILPMKSLTKAKRPVSSPVRSAKKDKINPREDEHNQYPMAVPAKIGSGYYDGFTIARREVVDKRLEVLKSDVKRRGPPALYEKLAAVIDSVKFIVTLDKTLTNGQVAECNIALREVYLHPYYFSLEHAGLSVSAKEKKQVEIIYHEVVSHIIKGLSDKDDAAMKDTEAYIDTDYRSSSSVEDLIIDEGAVLASSGSSVASVAEKITKKLISGADSEQSVERSQTAVEVFEAVQPIIEKIARWECSGLQEAQLYAERNDIDNMLHAIRSIEAVFEEAVALTAEARQKKNSVLVNILLNSFPSAVLFDCMNFIKKGEAEALNSLQRSIKTYSHEDSATALLYQCMLCQKGLLLADDTTILNVVNLVKRLEEARVDANDFARDKFFDCRQSISDLTKKTITSILLYDFVEKIIKTYPDASKTIKGYADMLAILEEYLADSGKIRGGPVAVAYFDPNKNEVIYNLSENEIVAALKNKYSPEEIRSLIVFIKEHEELHRHLHEQGVTRLDKEVEEGIILSCQLNRRDFHVDVDSKEFINEIVEQFNFDEANESTTEPISKQETTRIDGAEYIRSSQSGLKHNKIKLHEDTRKYLKNTIEQVLPAIKQIAEAIKLEVNNNDENKISTLVTETRRILDELVETNPQVPNEIIKATLRHYVTGTLVNILNFVMFANLTGKDRSDQIEAAFKELEKIIEILSNLHDLSVVVTEKHEGENLLITMIDLDRTVSLDENIRSSTDTNNKNESSPAKDLIKDEGVETVSSSTSAHRIEFRSGRKYIVEVSGLRFKLRFSGDLDNGSMQIYSQSGEYVGHVYGVKKASLEDNKERFGIRGLDIEPRYRGKGLSVFFIREFMKRFPNKWFHENRNPILGILFNKHFGYEPVNPQAYNLVHVGRYKENGITPIYFPHRKNEEVALLANGVDLEFEISPNPLTSYTEAYIDTDYRSSLSVEELIENEKEKVSSTAVTRRE
ncbi:MAG: hypothetical protein KKF78_05760, partial [Candidatus Omnitrophica bacterium]|nr:hypothetical protein [Candidatus Omnitrophota bacterium]